MRRKEIDSVMSELKRLWLQYPEMRLGQLLENLLGCNCIFHRSDKEILDAARRGIVPEIISDEGPTLGEILKVVMLYPESYPQIKTISDFFDYAGVPEEDRTDFAFAAALKQSREDSDAGN